MLRVRIGCDAFGPDLDPVVCLINKVLLEEIPRRGPKLAEGLERAGAEIKKQAEQELAGFYPCLPAGRRLTPTAAVRSRTFGRDRSLKSRGRSTGGDAGATIGGTTGGDAGATMDSRTTGRDAGATMDSRTTGRDAGATRGKKPDPQGMLAFMAEQQASARPGGLGHPVCLWLGGRAGRLAGFAAERFLACRRAGAAVG